MYAHIAGIAAVGSYMRCLAFLYLRYVHPPAKLMEWYEEFLGDDQPVKVHVGNHPPTYAGMAVGDRGVSPSLTLQ